MLQILLEKLSRFLSFTSSQTYVWALKAAYRLDEVLPQDHDRRKWVIVGFFSLPVLGAVVAIAGNVTPPDESNGVRAAETVVEAIQLNVDRAEALAMLPLVRHETIRHGDHILGVLRRVGANVDGLQSFLSADKDGKLLFSKLKAGRSVSVQLDENNNLMWLEYELDQSESYVESLRVERTREGQFSAEVDKQHFERDLAYRFGYVSSSLFSAADQADVPESIAVKMAEIFSAQIDFHRELQRGDRFRVIYEQYSLNGQPVATGNILALDFENGGRSYKAYYFDSKATGRSGFYDHNGRSLRSAFLRSPLRFSRISSRFSKRRFHPLQKRWKAHHGIDYAAPRGTPIRATATGKVKFIGRNGGYGKAIFLKHHNGYSTRYAHLSRYARGLRKGDRVEQGQIIGYVGTTGWSTGPHLHYELRIHNKPKDPLKIKMTASAEPLNRREMVHFKRTQLALDRRLNLVSSVQLASYSP